MTIFTSSMISGAIGQQVGMFSGYGGYAQQLGPQGMMQQQQRMPQLGLDRSMRQGMGGMYGEQMAARMGNFAQTAMGVGTAGLGLASAFSPIPLDPFSGAMMGARMGLGGMAGGAALGAMGALPMYAATQAAAVYGGAFTGGMQDQAALNSTMRNNFQHFGGQGAMGRGFSQNQMGQVGQMISGELRRNPMSSGQEMNALISGGADSGMLTGVRDVQAFTQKFRTMLNTLKDVQRELGGTLTDALSFVRGSQQAGIFRQADQTNFAAEIRGAEAVTGMDRNQLVALSAQGAQISRAYGGIGRQGAMGALRGVQALGAAVQSGAVNQELLSEATGGLQGAEALSAWTGQMMQRSGQFSRRGMGRFGLFALSNENGTGLDEGELARFNAGDLSTSEVSSRAHRNVNRMGRARAINREGMLRGAVMEQGGLSTQIGMMRLMVGDRIMDQSDDMASLVMQRRFHMSRPQSELMMSLMRNQGTIAQEEALASRGARRQTEIGRDVTENRSFDGFMRHLEHGMSDSMGVTKARELGRSMLTKISSLTERAMNDMMGIAGTALNSGDERSLNRMFMGRANAADISRLSTAGAAGGDMVNAESLFARSMTNDMLHSLGVHTELTAGETLSRRGVRGLGGEGAGATARGAIEQARMAQSGMVLGDSAAALARLEGNEERTNRRISQASLMASALGDQSRLYQLMGSDANATDAYMARHGMRASMGTGVPSTANLGAGGRIASGVRALFGGEGADELMGSLSTPEENAASFFNGGNRSFYGNLSRQANGTSAADVRETIAYMTETMHNRPTEEIDAAIARTLGRSENRAALLLEGARGGNDPGRGAAMEAVLGSEAFQERARGILTAGSNEGLQDRLSALRQYGGTLEDEKQRMAVMSIAEQIGQGAGPNGEITGALRGALSSAGMDPRRVAEIRTRRADMASQYGDMSRMLGASGNLGGLTDAFASARKAMAGDGDPTQTVSAARQMLASLSTDDPRYEQAMTALSGSEGGRAFIAGAAQDRQQRRDMSGRGRRGAAGAAEAALSAVTGGSLSEMEFEIGGRTISGSDRNAAQQLMRQLRNGGEGGSQVMMQLQRQLQEMGVGRDEASNLVGTLAAGAADGTRGGLSESSITDLVQQSGSSTALETVRREGVERMQRDRDPLGVQRNNLLEQINTGIQNMNNRASEGGQSLPTGTAS